MNRTSPPPRWKRRTIAVAPAAGLTTTTLAVLLLRTNLAAVIMTVYLLSLLVVVWLIRKELREERHATWPMQARYRALARLIDDAGDDVLVDADGRFVIMLVSHRGRRGGPVPRSVLRFRRGEFFAAGQHGIRTEVVFEQFLLDTVRPVVRYRIDVIAITRSTDGSTRIAAVPRPDLGRRNAARNIRVVARLAADIPAIAELDTLINQVHSSTVSTTPPTV